jgi:tetratricopeptide (TPR) repeat protein
MRLLSLLWLLISLPALASSGEELQREYARALLLTEAGKHAEALRSLRRVVELDPSRLDAALRLAVLEARLGEDAGAEKRLRAILAREPTHADAQRELAALLLLRGRPAEAREALARVVAARPQDAAARYYLGLALLSLGQLAPARDSLATAAQLAPLLASQAQYQIAVCHQRAGDLRLARAGLDAAIRAGTDPATVERARTALAEIDRLAPEAAKRWDLGIVLGAVFDSNVSLLPDLASDLPLPAGTRLVSADAAVTSAAAGRLYADLSFEGRPVVGAHRVALGAGVYQSKHLPHQVSGSFEPPYFDLTSFGVYASYGYDTRIGSLPFHAEVTAGHVEYLLDTFRSIRHYLQRPWIQPALSLRLASWTATRLSYQFAVENYGTDNPEGTRDDRDGFEHLVALEQHFTPVDWLTLRVTLSAGVFGADGDQWDALLTGVGLEAWLRLRSWLRVAAGVDYLHRGFGHSRYLTTGADLQLREVERVDDRLSAFARLTFHLSRFSISLYYTLQHNSSSAQQIFSYTRHLAGLETGFRY